MKININRDNLVSGLSKVSGIVDRKQTLPILSNLLVIVRPGQIELIATDLELEIHISIMAYTDDQGSFTVSARKFTDICRAITEGTEVNISYESERVVIRANTGRFTLSTLPASDYPLATHISTETTLTITTKELRNLLYKTAFAMAIQDVRHYLNGLLLEVKNGLLIAVATDGHRLAKACRTFRINEIDEIQVILPRKVVLELLRQIPDTTDQIHINLNKKYVCFTYGNTIMMTKLIDAKYPTYERVIPRGEGRVAIINRDILRHALMRVSILLNDKYKGVLLNFAPGILNITSHNPEQEEASEEQTITYKDEQLSIAYNVDYLLDVLGALEKKEAEFRIIDDNGSMRIIEENDQTNTYVIMPMRL